MSLAGGLLWRARSSLRLLRAAVRPMRQRGRALHQILLWQLPAAVALRGWRAVAGKVNARLLTPWLNAKRFARFQDSLPVVDGLRLYLIVMPNTLHFLLPCLALLHGRAPIVLVANGAKRWERELLRQRLPDLSMFVLQNLPLSSLPHGDAVSLLIREHRGDFAIVDHDAYIFDPSLLEQLRPSASECMVAVYAQASQRCNLVYPLTHVLGLQAENLCRLMDKYAVDARLYREAPASTLAALQRIGLGRRTFMKDYQQFHDTLHVLLAVALAEGLQLRIADEPEESQVFHVGGTSIGSHHTKNLFALYIHMRFLELLGDPLISARYAYLIRPLRSAAEMLERRPPADPAWDTLPTVEALMQRLQAAGAGHAFRIN